MSTNPRLPGLSAIYVCKDLAHVHGSVFRNGSQVSSARGIPAHILFDEMNHEIGQFIDSWKLSGKRLQVIINLSVLDDGDAIQVNKEKTDADPEEEMA